MSVTLRQVAAEAGVSPGTASRALHGHPQVSVDCVAKVRAVAERLGYVPLRHRSGRSRAQPLEGKRIAIAMIGIDRTLAGLPVVAEAIHGAEDALAEAGAQTMLVSMAHPAEPPRSLRRVKFDGMLAKAALQGRIMEAIGGRLRATLGDTPLVWMLGRPANAPGDVVDPDDATGGRGHPSDRRRSSVRPTASRRSSTGRLPNAASCRAATSRSSPAITSGRSWPASGRPWRPPTCTRSKSAAWRSSSSPGGWRGSSPRWRCRSRCPRRSSPAGRSAASSGDPRHSEAAGARWGNDGLRAVSGTSEISGPMTLGNLTGTLMNIDEGAQLTISGNVIGEGSNSRFNVAGTGEVIVTGVIGQLNTGNAGGLFGNPTVHLLGLNQFTGQFNVGTGTVVVNTLYNTGFESSLGTGTGPSGIITNMASGAGTVQATLRYIGEETSTNRQVRFMSNVAGARNVIEASGTGQLRFSNGVFNATLGRPPQNLVLSGTNAGLIEGRIQDNRDGGVISLIKEGTGTWILKDPTTYTGTTTITAGTLEIAAPLALQSTSGVTVDTGGTLLLGATIKTNSVIIDGGTLSAANLAVNNTDGITALAVNAGTLAGSPAVAIDGGGTMSLVQDARVTVGVGSLSVDEGGTGGRLDLGAGQVSVAAGGITAEDLRADIIAGRNGGAWNGGTGIMSSAAAGAPSGTRAVGYVVGGDGSAQVSFAAPGDTDLSGQVNVFDLLAIDSAGAFGTGNYFPAEPTAVGFGSVAAVPEPGRACSLVGDMRLPIKPERYDGLIVSDSRRQGSLKISDVPDGLSKTFLAGEMHVPKVEPPEKNSIDMQGSIYNGDDHNQFTRAAGGGWADRDDNLNTSNPAAGKPGREFFQILPLASSPNDMSMQSPFTVFGSWHAGGACGFVMADGSVRGVRPEIDLSTLSRLGNRRDGLPITGDW